MTVLLAMGKWIITNPLTATLMGLCAVLGTGLGWAHAITIPLLEYKASAAVEAQAKATTALAGANAATAECNNNQDNLRAQVDQQNQQISSLQAAASASDQRADSAGAAVAKQQLRPPPAGKTAADVNAYLQSLRVTP